MWRFIKPPLVFADKLLNFAWMLTRHGQIEWRTISARWGSLGGHDSSNPIVNKGCDLLDVIDPTTDDHCGEAKK